MEPFLNDIVEQNEENLETSASFEEKAAEYGENEPIMEEQAKTQGDSITESVQSDSDATQNEDGIDQDALIVCDSVVKIYKTENVEVMALQGLDLVIQKGEMLSIIGKSGSGKSTLMNMIGGLEKPSAGKLYVSGRDMSLLTEKEMVKYRKKTVGFVWQKSSRNLFPYLTSQENVEVSMSFTKRSAKEKRERALYLLELVGMIHKKDSYPGQMSGGEQQRVAIAVALANEPDILLADEPTGAVDTKTADAIQEVFKSLNRQLGVTIIIVTHDMRLADLTDRVVMISDGKISTEKIRKEEQSKLMGQTGLFSDTHEEYSVMDKANRVQLDKDMLAAAGIKSNKVRVTLDDGKLIITSGDNN